MYLDGIGVPHDPVESARLLRSASDKGFAAAQFNLGFLYEYGIGVTRNLKQAEYYYQLAANQGYTKAIYRLEIVKTRRGNSIKASQQYATTTTPSRQELNPSIKLESKEEHIRRGIITREKCEKAFVTHMKRKGINCQPKYMLDCDDDPQSPVYFYGDFYVGTFDIYYVEFFLEENNEITWKTKQLKW